MRPSLAVAVIALVLSAAVAAGERVGVNCRTLTNPVNMASRQCICQPCHVCEFSFTKLKCQLIVDSNVDTSDGSNVKPAQPTLDPAAWFLSESAITASRGGVKRSDMSVYTEGNKVATFAVGSELFASVLKDFQATAANDAIYLIGWSSGEVPFDPVNDKTGATTGFKALVTAALKRGVDFRALVWQNLIERNQNLALRDYINGLSDGRFIFDDRLPYLASSHHQKTIVIKQQNELVAYVGGIDLTTDRWDTLKHDASVLRREAKIFALNEGWLDGSLRLKGPASLDVSANFLARWNSKAPNSNDLLDDVLEFENPKYPLLPPLNVPKPVADGSNAVQITRTFSCKSKDYAEFAPKGERSLLQGRIQAIRQARNYIYIEDQYFVEVPELIEALLSVLPRLQRLIVVVQPTGTETKVTGYGKYLFDMVAPLQKKFPNKIQLYTTKAAKKLYIHTKVVIIDDVYLSVGSANWNRRSMTSDSEMCANVVDRAEYLTPEGHLVAFTARDYRLRKFMEMTGKSYEALDAMKFIDAANAFDAAVKDPTSILDAFEVDEKPIYSTVTDALHNFADPYDVC